MYTEKIVVNEGGKYPLNGILTLPENKDGNYPAVVFVHGSGSSNMDEKVMKMTPFKDIAEGLAKRGIASIRYDKRSFAHGLKMIREKNITVYEETIEDAIAATNLLRKDKCNCRNHHNKSSTYKNLLNWLLWCMLTIINNMKYKSVTWKTINIQKNMLTPNR